MHSMNRLPVRSLLGERISRSLRLACSGALIAASAPAWAGCDNTAPTTGQTVTCSTAAPNPGTTAVTSVAGANAITVNIVPRAQLSVASGNAITLQGGSGHVLTNDGSILATAGAGLFLSGAATVVNRGVISGSAGGIVFGAGDDRLDMLGGSISGGVLQGAGNDAMVMRAGTVSGVDQGDGQDSLEISGGTITGTVQQGNGIDTFLMTGGSIGALLQGDAYDRFRMTGGRIVGAFDDGDYAEMTGGQIGRVNMKLDDNVFLMSGGTIDGNLVTGFGRDTIVLSDGYIGGNISVSGGDDAVTISGGTVRGEIRLSLGNDRLDWAGGGVVYGLVDFGEGNDVASLSSLNAAHLGALPGFDGGLGNDTLLMDNVKTSGVARFTGWESIALRNDSQMMFDGPLRLGDAGSGTGSLDVDATSTLFAGGVSAGIVAFNSALPVTVANAGRIDLSNGGTGAGDVFTIAGNYTGNGGALYLQSVLGADDSPSDRLVISNGVASGTTGIGILNVGGQGAATAADGILVVQSINGASTTPTAFALYNPLAAGAFEYFLFKGGVSAGSGENWYLRSTLVGGAAAAAAAPPTGVASVTPEPPPPDALGAPPPPLPPPPSPDVPENPNPVAAEPAPPPPPPEPAPVAAAAEEPPPAVPTAAAAVPGPLSVPPSPDATPAQGDIIPLYRLETGLYSVVPPLLRETSLASLGTFHERQGEQRVLAGQGGVRAAWARLIGQSHEQHWDGDAEPGFDGDIQGIQAGVFVGRTRAQGNVSGFAIGWENVAVGRTRLDDKHVGLYWTRVGSAGGYLDAVLMQSRYDGDATSSRGLGIDVKGDGTTASLEIGKPLLRVGQSAWWLEPQLQVIWQRTAIDDAADRIAPLRFGGDDAWTGRIGLRLAGDYDIAGNGWQPYLKLNYWQTLTGEDHIDFDSNRIINQQASRALEVGVGVVARFNANVSAFAVADYTRDLESSALKERRVIEGNLGLRFDW
ncbi:autotransporter domain-containing protein [Stenotrophomonas sp. PD6]|uniref:autotransporter family protein n=1 Tax=Stenotrophomonas sp. PD6 TaxID=3368612 RepID=UPI003B9DC672